MVFVFDWQLSPILGNATHQQVSRQRYFKSLWDAHEELSTTEVAAARCRFFDIADTTPTDYVEQAITLTLPDRPPITGWAGIRFRNLDARTPFVAVSLTLDPQAFLQPAALQALHDFLQPRYSRFVPHGFTLRIPVSASHLEALQNTPDQAPTAIPHQVWNTYWFKALSTLNPAPNPSQVQLVPLKNLEDPHFDYARFHAQHQLWRLLHGNLAPWIEAASEEELAESCQAKLCYLAYTSQNEPIGIVAGQVDDYYGIQGVSVLELFIYPSYQGKGYGKAMQLLFQERLKAQGHTALWGSIHAENLASWHTARACGRTMVEQECFFPFNDLEA